MAITGFVSSQRTRTRNCTLHNQFNLTRKLIDKESNISQRKLDARSKECIHILKKLRDDSKKMTNIGNFWKMEEDKEKMQNTVKRRAASAPIKRGTFDAYRKTRPKTAKSAHVLKFEKLESNVPEMDAFQVYCYKIKEPVSQRVLVKNAQDLVPRNMNKFEDTAPWSDVARAAEWLDATSNRKQDRSLDSKSPLIVAEFTTKVEIKQDIDDVFLDDDDDDDNDGSDQANGDSSINQDNQITSQPSSPIEKRIRWANALRQVARMSSAVGGFSRQSAVNMEQMFRTHEREMRNSGMRSALQSTSQLQQAKVLQHISGLEPVSDRDLKQKILNAQNALQKDMEAAKQAKQRYSEKLLALEEAKKTINSKKVSMQRISVVSSISENEMEEMDLLQSIVLPNLKINDEMEKRVASYLEANKPIERERRVSVRKKESVRFSMDEIEVARNDEHIIEPIRKESYHEISLDRLRERRREMHVRKLIELDDERRARAASITTRSLMGILRGAQQKLERVYQCQRELDASLIRVDKKRPPPTRVIYPH